MIAYGGKNLMLIETHQKRTRMLVAALTITVILCGAMLCRMMQIRAEVHSYLVEMQTLNNNETVTALKWHILELEKENEYLRQRNAQLEEILSEGA